MSRHSFVRIEGRQAAASRLHAIEVKQYWWLFLSAWVFISMLIIYEFDMHPLYGFFTGLTLAWLICEDGLYRQIDMRIALGLLMTVLIWQRPVLYTLCMMAAFWALFEAARHVFAKFDKMDSEIDPNDECPLVDESAPGFMPFLGVAIVLLFFADMMFYPIGYFKEWAASGSSFAECVWLVHLGSARLKDYMVLNSVLPALLAFSSIFFMELMIRRTRKKAQQGKMALYPMGDGDPIVLGGLAGLMGPEIFWFAVLPLSAVIGLMYILFRRKTDTDSADVC